MEEILGQSCRISKRDAHPEPGQLTFPKCFTWDGSWHSHTPAQTLLSEAPKTADQPGGQLPIRITLKLGEPDGQATTQLCTHAWGGVPRARERTPDETCDHTVRHTVRPPPTAPCGAPSAPVSTTVTRGVERDRATWSARGVLTTSRKKLVS